MGLRRSLIIAIVSLFSATKLFAATEYPYMALEFLLGLDTQGLPTILSGQVGIELNSKAVESCFYVPYNDPDYGFDRESTRKYRPPTANVPKELYFGGSTAIELRSQGFSEQWLTPYLYKLAKVNTMASSTVLLSVNSILPRLHEESKENFFYRGFYPIPLAKCPTEPFDQHKFIPTPAFEIHTRITTPLGFAGAFPQQEQYRSGQSIAFKADVRREFSFALSTSYKEKRVDSQAGSMTFYFHKDQFLDLAPTATAILEAVQQWLGPFPFNHLSIVETSEVQALGIPGLLAINQPPQTIFRSLQSKYLNWQHWSLARQIVAQWFAGASSVASAEDAWVSSGFIDFLCLEALKKTARFDLFNTIFSDFRLASLDYRQGQDIAAAILQRQSPFTRLTGPDLLSAEPPSRPSPFYYIRHSLALRQSLSILGHEMMQTLMRDFFATIKYRLFRPKDFYNFLMSPTHSHDTDLYKDAAQHLRTWWESEGWPDYAIGEIQDVKMTDGTWQTIVEIEQLGEVSAPVKVRLRDKMHREYWAQTRGHPSSAEKSEPVVFKTFSPRANISIDPNREIFDSDRFNNSTRVPTLRFFPGTANTMSDADYTVFWGPYALRRPGEPFTLGLTGALFRYLNSGLYFNFEGDLTGDLGAVRLRHQKIWSTQALLTNTSFEQDFYGLRTTAFAIEREPLLSFGPVITAIFKARQRHLVGAVDSRHYTVAGGLKIVPPGFFKLCGFNNAMESEYAPSELSKSFSYQRHKWQLSGQCNVGPNVSFGGRIFRGFVITDDNIPVSTLFRINDVQEAMVRIDRNDLKPSHSILTTSAHISGPLFLPLPGSSLLLANRLRLQGFYDFGRSFESMSDVDYRASGLTLKLPLGGELTGAGTFSVTNLAITAILYSNSDGDISRKPSLLFDMFGEF